MTKPAIQQAERERILQGLSFSYGQLAASTHHQPSRSAFKTLATMLGMPEEDFEAWADQREWGKP